MHIQLEDAWVRRIDRVAGARGRSRFVREAIRVALEQTQRWDLIEAAAGVISSADHDWDANPSAWVRAQRRGDRRRVG
jgi:metal-responsive CopG/Arc/MetJ family transcriptional regulator